MNARDDSASRDGTCLRDGCNKPVMEDDLCEDHLVDAVIEYVVQYRRKDDPDPPVLVLFDPYVKN